LLVSMPDLILGVVVEAGDGGADCSVA
jgi:hypothetical protein